MSDSTSGRRVIPIWMWPVAWLAVVPYVFLADSPLWARAIIALPLAALTLGLFNKREA